MSNITLKCIHQSDGKCRDCSDDLTFAEAMSLDPSEAEASWGTTWLTLRKCADSHTLADFRCANFRRARLRRSRVQEMASGPCPVNTANSSHVTDRMEQAIRAVCEYLRTERIGALAAVGPEGAEHAWSAISRHFLEPR